MWTKVCCVRKTKQGLKTLQLVLYHASTLSVHSQNLLTPNVKSFPSSAQEIAVQSVSRANGQEVTLYKNKHFTDIQYNCSLTNDSTRKKLKIYNPVLSRGNTLSKSPFPSPRLGCDLEIADKDIQISFQVFRRVVLNLRTTIAELRPYVCDLARRR